MTATSQTEIVIECDALALHGTLAVPPRASGLVLFAHGSGSSRFSPRNRHVAAGLNRRGLATLLFDLLTPEEERIDALDTTLRFDIDLLAERLIAATDWVVANRPAGHLPIAYFGASTGAAAALIAAARRPRLIAAVVSRGGRPDLASRELARVQAPTLLIVGGNDEHVLALNRRALRDVTAPIRIAVIAGASHLFEESGALDEVTRLAGDWLVQHMPPAAVAPQPQAAAGG